MPKKKQTDEEYDEEDYEGMDEEELDEEEVEMLRKEKMIKKPRFKKKVPEPKVPPQRYAVFNQPQRVGIADNETGEVIAEGEFSILQMLAKISGQLENIENNLGSMMER